MKTLFFVELLCLLGLASAQITVTAPTASPSAGTYSGHRFVTLTTTTGASAGQPNTPYAPQVIYSTAGVPTYLSTHYANPIGLTASETIEAFAFLPIIQQSPGSCAPSTGVQCSESHTATTSSTSPWPEWKPVCDAVDSCGGGTQVPSSTVHAIVTSLPGSVATLSGRATQLGETANGTTGQYNSLWVYKAAGANDPPICTSGKCTYFYEDYYIYFPSSNGYSQGEMENDIDDFDDVTGFQNVWGTQCNFVAGVWEFANQSGTGWQKSTVACNDGRHSGTVNMPQNSWIHVQKGVHLTTTGCLANSTTVPAPSGAAPCLYFDYLAINGTYYPNWGKVLAAQTGASYTLAGTQFQMDAHCSTCSINEYIDEASITAGQISSTASFAYTINPLTAKLPMTVTSANPTLLSTYLTAPGSASSLTVGQTLQFSLFCHYSSGPDQSCTGTDIYGDAATSFTSSNTAVATIGAAGSANAGLVTAVAPGSDSIQAMVGAVSSSTWGLTISNPSVTLSNISLATTGGVTSIALGQTNQLRATCTYSDGSTTSCTTADSHGNYAAGWTSSNPSLATVSGSGLVAAVASGSVTFSATADGHTSASLPLTISAIPPGTYTITITGPVVISGTVTF